MKRKLLRNKLLILVVLLSFLPLGVAAEPTDLDHADKSGGGVSFFSNPLEKLKRCFITDDIEYTLLKEHHNVVFAVAFSPDSRTLASGGADEEIILWDVATETRRRTFSGHGDTIASIAFSPDGKMIASVSYDKTAILWDIATGDKQKILEGHTKSLKSVTFSPDGMNLAAACKENVVILFHLGAKKEQ